MDLAHKVALITGGGTGLGRACAHRMAAEGAHIAVCYPAWVEKPQATIAELHARRVRAEAFECDVSDESQVAALIAQVMDAFGHIDVLVNCAGTTAFVPMDDLDGMTADDWDRIMAVNVKGPFLCSKTVAPIMREQGRGSIVNIGSIAAFRPAGSSMAYCVSKAGLTHLTKCLARALAPEITVNVIAPGTMVTGWYPDWTEDDTAREIELAPLDRLSELEDVASAVLEAAKNDSMTGQALIVDAGLLLRV